MHSRLFAPFSLPGLGSFQDGALRHNNPINIALWESSRIWTRDTPKDIVLSLGTGTTANNASPQTRSSGQTFSDKFIPRLCRSFLTSLDGELIWRDLLNHQESDSEHRFFRLNINFGSHEPRLDDVTAMDGLSQAVNAAKDDDKIAEIRMALLASSFFLELKRAPRFDASGFYVCQAEIRLRGDISKIFLSLRQISTAPIAFYKDGISLGSIDQSTDLCPGCYRFRKKLCFFIRHPTETVPIFLDIDGLRRQISGFPQAMAWFTNAQHLESPFYSEKTLSLPRQPCEWFELDKPNARPTKRGLSSRWSLRSGRKRVKAGSSDVLFTREPLESRI